MFFKFLITRYASKIAHEVEAAALRTLVRTYRIVRIVTVFAFARCSPLIYIETFAARQPPHSTLLGATGNEPKGLALTFSAG